MPDERKIGTYTVVQSCDLGDKEVLLAEDTKKQNGKYGVATVSSSLVTFGTDPEFVALGNDYLSMLNTFASTIQKECNRMLMTRRTLEVPEGIIDPADLLSISDVDLEDKLICLYPDSLRSIYRTQAYQVVLAESGFGCSPNGRGRKIYGVEVATGDKVCYARSEVQGALDPNNLPRWMERKLSDPCFLKHPETGTWEHLRTLRLFCPLEGTIDPDEYNEYDDPVELHGAISQFADKILEAVEKERLPDEAERGLMKYYHPEEGNAIEESIANKVWSYYPTVEVVGKYPADKLYGVVECYLKEALTNKELEAFKEEVAGQLSDGWGEGFEQRPIDTDYGKLYVSFWSFDDSWGLTEESDFRSSLEQKGVQLL